jgi:hypothetical protein
VVVYIKRQVRWLVEVHRSCVYFALASSIASRGSSEVLKKQCVFVMVDSIAFEQRASTPAGVERQPCANSVRSSCTNTERKRFWLPTSAFLSVDADCPRRKIGAGCLRLHEQAWKSVTLRPNLRRLCISWPLCRGDLCRVASLPQHRDQRQIQAAKKMRANHTDISRAPSEWTPTTNSTDSCLICSR